MITEDYVSFEVAKLLKEKGLEGDTNCYYIEESVDKNLYYSPIKQNHNKRITNNEFNVYIDITSSRISAPTLQMAMKWLREVHNYNIEIDTIGQKSLNTLSWRSVIYNLEQDMECYYEDNFKSYEEAAEAGIKYCLENLI